MVWSQGEFTGDGTVDINDLTIVFAHSDEQRLGVGRRHRPRARAGRGEYLLVTGLVGLLAYALGGSENKSGESLSRFEKGRG